MLYISGLYYRSESCCRSRMSRRKLDMDDELVSVGLMIVAMLAVIFVFVVALVYVIRCLTEGNVRFMFQFTV